MFCDIRFHETHHLPLSQGTERPSYESLVDSCTVDVQDDCLETDVLFLRSALDPVYCLEVLQGLLAGISSSCHVMFCVVTFNSSSYGTSIGWCLYSLWVTCIQNFHGCYISFLMEALCRL